MYKSQAEELLSAISDILLSTENTNSETFNKLTDARRVARDTEQVYGGLAQAVLQDEDITFPSGLLFCEVNI